MSMGAWIVCGVVVWALVVAGFLGVWSKMKH